MSAGQLRNLKSRIKSVENTRKITRAMEMVSAAKLRRFQTMMIKARPYTHELEKILQNLAKDQHLRHARGALTAPSSQTKDKRLQEAGSFSHPFFEVREEKNAALLIITADAGLCGAHNMMLIDIARSLLTPAPDKAENPALQAACGTLAPPSAQLNVLFGLGKACVNSLKRSGFALNKAFTDVRLHQIEPVLKEMKNLLSGLYLEKKVDAVYAVYSHVISATTAKPAVEKLLPFHPPAGPKPESGTDDYIYEPSPAAIFNRIVPEFFEARLRMILLESFVAEHMARMNAMHQATKNAKEMIDSLVLVRNKIRQAIITKEIIEIISGSRAAKK